MNVLFSCFTFWAHKSSTKKMYVAAFGFIAASLMKIMKIIKFAAKICRCPFLAPSSQHFITSINDIVNFVNENERH